MSLPVLIVGAGPTGLALAFELARRGAPCRVLDRASCASNLDRATGVHALTLEMYERMGVVDEIVQGGVEVRRVLFFSEGQVASESRMDVIDSRYRFDLSISQALTERVLRQRLEALGVLVEWGSEVSGLQQSDDAVEVSLKGGTMVRGSWLVGCDGYHSAVRRLLGETFDGKDYIGCYSVLEARVEGLPFGPDVLAIMGGEHCLWAAPMPNGRRRLIYIDGCGPEAGPPTAEAARKVLEDHPPGCRIELSDLSDQARFGVHDRHVMALRHGRCLLAGDAAHTVSPAAGQGLNLGIHDAHNLGWKLARVVQGRAHSSLLDSYEPERKPCVAMGSQLSDAAQSSFTLTGDEARRRDEQSRAVASVPVRMAWALNGKMDLRMSFPDTPFVVGEPALPPQPGHRTWLGPGPGERVPDEGPLLLDGQEVGLHSLLRHPGHTVLLLLGNADDGAAPGWLAQETEELEGRAYLITAKEDPGLYVHGRLGVPRDTLLAIRPDGYVGLRSERLRPEALQGYRKRLDGDRVASLRP